MRRAGGVHRRARVERVGRSWHFHCPGCDEGHAFDERWRFDGNPFDPTFSPSLLIERVAGDRRPRCHLFLRDGWITFLPDSGHALAGRTVRCPVVG